MPYQAVQRVEDVDPDTGLPRTIFRIPAENREKFEKQISKLSRRSEKLIGLTINPIFFGRDRVENEDGSHRIVFEVLLTAETPRLNGWTFVARLDHANETGTIIRSVPNVGAEVPERYRHSEPNCDHCGVRRQRRDTFLLRCDEGDEKGVFRQVGSSCLADFFGHDPYKIARLAEILGYAHEVGRSSEVWSGGIADLRYIDIEDYLGHCAMAVRLFGWVSATQARETGVQATYDRALDSMLWQATRDLYEVTDEDRQFAVAAQSWARSLADKERKTEWENSVLVIANAEAMELRSAGFAASIVGVYARERARRAAGEALRTRMARSRALGQPGERLRDLRATVLTHKTLETDYGLSHLYRFITDDDAVLVWFATSGWNLREGDKVTVTGTVKRHAPREGVVETTLTRCRVIPEGPPTVVTA